MHLIIRVEIVEKRKCKFIIKLVLMSYLEMILRIVNVYTIDRTFGFFSLLILYDLEFYEWNEQ